MCFREDALAERHIVISGGCGAIGLGIVRKLTEHGARVTVNDIIDTTTADARLRDAGVDLEKTVYVRADLTQAPDVERLIGNGSVKLRSNPHGALPRRHGDSKTAARLFRRGMDADDAGERQNGVSAGKSVRTSHA